jgi:hypothetical protein
MNFTVTMLAKEGEFRALQIEKDLPGSQEFAESWPNDWFWFRRADESVDQFRARAEREARAAGEETLVFSTTETIEDDDIFLGISG